MYYLVCFFNLTKKQYGHFLVVIIGVMVITFLPYFNINVTLLVDLDPFSKCYLYHSFEKISVVIRAKVYRIFGNISDF